MMKRLFIIFILLFGCIGAMAQSRNGSTIMGTVVADTQDEGVEGVVGATIELMSLADTLQKQHTVTAVRGAWQFKQVKAGEYRLKAEFLGYKTATRDIKVERGKELNIQDWKLEEDPLLIETISIEAQAVRTTINGDTVVYNAAAYKVLPDADADKLLSKMPGIKIDGGTVEAQGETVQKILIDGREFFGNDVATALKTIPAEAIKSVEVFDKLSDEAEFSGIDDGNSYKAINIVTHNKMKTAVFGKMNGMYGTEPRRHENWQHYFDANANVNFFREKSKTSIRINANNTNGNADSRVGMGALNYINAWGKKDEIKLEGSYSFRGNNSVSRNWNEVDYFLSEEQIESNADDIYKRTESNSRSNSTSLNHQFSSRFEYRISPKQRLMLRASFNISDGKNRNNTLSHYFPVSGVNEQSRTNWSNSNNDNMGFSLNGNYHIQLGEKKGRTLHFSFNGGYNSGDGLSNSYSEYDNDIAIRQKGVNNSASYNINGNITYAEPLSKHSQLTANYNVRYNHSDAERLTHLYDFEKEEFVTDISPEYSNIYQNNFFTQRIGPGFRWGKEGSNISAKAEYQYVTMNSDRVYPSRYILPTKYFGDVTYAISTHVKINKQNHLNVRINSQTRNPSVNDLQNVVDISNVNFIFSGNPSLRPSYTHRMYLQYHYSGIEKGTNFSVTLQGNITQREIVHSIINNSPGYEIFSPDGELLTTLSSTGIFTKPINMNGAWHYHANIGYGFPIKFLGCNFLLGANGTYEQRLAMINNNANYSRNRSLGLYASIGSNFSKNIDFHAFYALNYNSVINSMSSSGDNEYMQQFAVADFRYVANFGLTFSADARLMQYVGLNDISSRLNNTEVICNIGLGYKVLKKLGEVEFIVRDLFNDSDGFYRHWSATSMSNNKQNVIGRYFGIRFTYNLRHYGKTRKGQEIGESGVNGMFRGHDFQ